MLVSRFDRARIHGRRQGEVSQEVEAAADGGIAASLRQRITGAEHPFGEGTKQLALFLFQGWGSGAAEVPASL